MIMIIMKTITTITMYDIYISIYIYITQLFITLSTLVSTNLLQLELSLEVFSPLTSGDHSVCTLGI